MTSTWRQTAARIAGTRGRNLYRWFRDGPDRTITQSVPTPAPPVGGSMSAAGATFWPATPPAGYRGQLADDWQRELARKRHGLTLADCDFYHAATLPDGTTVSGAWDLRGREATYLGEVDVGGQRVLEIGPASGALTFRMEEQGANVVAFDVGYDTTMDLLPFNGANLQAVRTDHMRALEPVQNAWWLQHRERGSKARIVYGDVYNLPDDLGPFDVAVFGAVLVHLRDPFAALEQAAGFTRSTMVVVDAIDHTIRRSRDPKCDTLRFNPTRRLDRWVSWWSMAPGAVVSMCNVLGFTDTTTTFHRQRHYEMHDRAAPPIEREMFTVVARRTDDSRQHWASRAAEAGSTMAVPPGT